VRFAELHDHAVPGHGQVRGDGVERPDEVGVAAGLDHEAVPEGDGEGIVLPCQERPQLDGEHVDAEVTEAVAGGLEGRRRLGGGAEAAAADLDDDRPGARRARELIEPHLDGRLRQARRGGGQEGEAREGGHA